MSRTVQAVFNGVVIAESDDTVDGLTSTDAAFWRGVEVRSVRR